MEVRLKSNLAHGIKHRTYANDEFMTPVELAKSLVGLLPEIRGTVLEPCPGDGAFVEALPEVVIPEHLYISDGDFYEWMEPVDWIVTNPPYSQLDRWMEHCFRISMVGVALLVGLLNITPRRIELANSLGFGLTQIHLCKVFHWFGISAFVVFEKGRDNIITYDRVVWR